MRLRSTSASTARTCSGTARITHAGGWLEEDTGPGAYHQERSSPPDARTLDNRTVEPTVLRWLIEAAVVNADRVTGSREAAHAAASMLRASGRIRQHVPCEAVATALPKPRRHRAASGCPVRDTAKIAEPARRPSPSTASPEAAPTWRRQLRSTPRRSPGRPSSLGRWPRSTRRGRTRSSARLAADRPRGRCCRSAPPSSSHRR